MAGNVREWVQDAWHDSYDTNADGISDAPSDGSAWTSTGIYDRVVRGGSLKSNSNDVRTRSREKSYMYDYDTATGFRCARSVVMLEGYVKPLVEPVSPGDGIGTLCIAIMDACPSETVTETAEYAQMEIYGADLSYPAALVSFWMSVPENKLTSGNGSLAVVAALIEEGGSCGGVGPGPGDMMTFENANGSAGCAIVDAAGPYTGLYVELNYIIPDDGTWQ
jgi:hypothetical protein